DTALYAVGGSGDQWGIPTPVTQRLALADWDGGTWHSDAVTPLPASQQGIGGFCTESHTGGEIWSIGGEPSLWQRALFLPTCDRCPSLLTELDWLRVPEPGTVASADQQRLRVTV